MSKNMSIKFSREFLSTALSEKVFMSWLIGKDSDARKDWRHKKKGVTEDEMVRWHHWFNGHEFEQIPGDSEGQRKPGMLQAVGFAKSQTRLNDWTGTSVNYIYHVANHILGICLSHNWLQIFTFWPPSSPYKDITILLTIIYIYYIRYII